ncbi:MAG: hypothetical protein HRT35_27755 [Algicola sp.]|nr:hypothetical protein [Algicola sp.]
MTQKIQCLFLIARAVQWCKKTEAGMGAVEMTNRFLWSNEEIYDVGTELSLAKNEYNKKYDELGGIATVLTDSLALYHEKPITAQRETREQLNEMRGMLVKLDPDGLVSYHANWLEAKWFVFAGDLAQALVLYKKAFEQCLYTAGERQKDIILQALVVAAMMEDKPFLKRLKNQAIVFDWFVAPTLEDDSKINNHKSRARTNVVEDWEVDAFKANFKQMFAPNSWFVGCDYPQAQDCLGPFLSVDFDKIKPDYKNPNRKIKIGDVRTKITPQLVWFSEREQLDVVEKLLAEGATVNVHSHSGETPILMAVQAMNTLIPGTLLNDRCFKMVSAHEHQSEIINMRSTKRKLLPLICSVYSGRPAVVAKLLELGAEVDRRGGIDNQTALNHTIGLIGKRLDLVKYTAGVNRDFNNPTEANLESLRRSFAGLTGITKKQQAEAMANMRNNDKFREYMDSGLQALVGGMAKSLSLDALRQTAHVLIIKPLKN